MTISKAKHIAAKHGFRVCESWTVKHPELSWDEHEHDLMGDDFKKAHQLVSNYVFDNRDPVKLRELHTKAEDALHNLVKFWEEERKNFIDIEV
jgi:hypothetical protein